MKLLIEVGAYDGSDSLRYHARGYTVYTFEPKRDLYASLSRRTKELMNYTVVPKAVCLTNGITEFYICKEGGASSILPFRSDEELNQHWSVARQDVHYSGVSYEVETTRLDTFLEANNLQDTPIDFLHIDAQGVDLDVLKSLGKYIINLKGGVVETVIDPAKSIYLNQESNNIENVKQFLKENGFEISAIERNDSTSCEYNVIFTRKGASSA